MGRGSGGKGGNGWWYPICPNHRAFFVNMVRLSLAEIRASSLTLSEIDNWETRFGKRSSSKVNELNNPPLNREWSMNINRGKMFGISLHFLASLRYNNFLREILPFFYYYHRYKNDLFWIVIREIRKVGGEDKRERENLNCGRNVHGRFAGNWSSWDSREDNAWKPGGQRNNVE